MAHVQSCSAGTRLRGCPALEVARVCVDCVHGAGLVASQRAHWLPNVPGAVCNWACNAEYYYSEFEATCVVCTDRRTCPVGQRWQACTNTTDAQCASCPNLRAIKGRFGDNEEYVESVASDVTEECQTACKEGHFRSEDGLCRRCSTHLRAAPERRALRANKDILEVEFDVRIEAWHPLGSARASLCK